MAEHIKYTPPEQSADMERKAEILVSKDRTLADFDGQKQTLTRTGLDRSTIINTPGFIAGLPPKQLSIDAINTLQDANYKVSLLVVPIVSNGTYLEETYDWELEHLGSDSIEKTVITRRKDLIRTDKLIEVRHSSILEMNMPETVVYDANNPMYASDWTKEHGLYIPQASRKNWEDSTNSGDYLTPEQTVVLVDMDEVVTGLYTRVCTILERDYPGITIVPPEERESYLSSLNYKDDAREVVKKIINSPDFISSIPPRKEAIEALKAMRSAGFDVVICTGMLIGNRVCAQQKFKWIIDNLGPEWADRIVIIQDRTLVYGHYLIDDNPNPAEKGKVGHTWEQIVLSAPYNHTKDHPRLKDNKRIKGDFSNWEEIIKPPRKIPMGLTLYSPSP